MVEVTRLVKCAGKSNKQKLRMCEKLLGKKFVKGGHQYKVYEAVIALDKDEEFIRIFAEKK